MKWKYEKEFRAAHPETVGETDSEFDLDNYKDFLESLIEKSNGIKPPLCDGWRDVTDKPDKYLGSCLVALTNGEQCYVREAMYDCYIGDFITTIGMNPLESVYEDGDKKVWIYKWREMIAPPAFV